MPCSHTKAVCCVSNPQVYCFYVHVVRSSNVPLVTPVETYSKACRAGQGKAGRAGVGSWVSQGLRVHV